LQGADAWNIDQSRKEPKFTFTLILIMWLSNHKREQMGKISVFQVIDLWEADFLWQKCF